MLTVKTKAPEETEKLAGQIANIVYEGLVICLDGDLGAGKTLFVRSLAKALGVEGEVTSPTFNLMNIYDTDRKNFKIYHFDLYRLETSEELEEIGFYEYAEEPEGMVVIEWSDKFPDDIPDDILHIEISRGEKDDSDRILNFDFRHRYGNDSENEITFMKKLEDICRK